MDAAADPMAEGTARRPSDAPRRVALVGNYGSANLGDELLLRVVSGWARDAGIVPVAISVNPAHTKRMHGIDAVSYADPGAIARAIGESDLLVLGGGGLLQDYDDLHEDALAVLPAFGTSQFAQYVLMAGTLGVSVVALAQGVGPLRDASARRIARHVFDSLLAGSLRDDASAALLREVGCRTAWPVAPDPGWAWSRPTGEALAPAQIDPALAGRPVLAIVLRDWPFDPAWEDRVVGAFRAALPAEWGCLWMDFHRDPERRGGHSAFVQRMAARLPGIHAEWTGETLEEASRLIDGSDAVLAMRLHALLLAGLAGRPVAALEYDHKVAALADAIGMPDRQRVPLEAIATRLPVALAAICGPGRDDAFRVDARVRDRMASGALLHRDVLAGAIALVAPPPSEPPVRYRWMAQWARNDGATAQALVDALEARLHRQLDCHHAQLLGLHEEQGRLAAALREETERREREIERRERETERRERAEAEVLHWQARCAAIERSRSYRLTSPLRRLAGYWRTVSGKEEGI